MRLGVIPCLVCPRPAQSVSGVSTHHSRPSMFWIFFVSSDSGCCLSRILARLVQRLWTVSFPWVRFCFPCMVFSFRFPCRFKMLKCSVCSLFTKQTYSTWSPTIPSFLGPPMIFENIHNYFLFPKPSNDFWKYTLTSFKNCLNFSQLF